MPRSYQWLLLSALLLPAALPAQTLRYVRLTGGQVFINHSQSQTIAFNSSYWKTNVFKNGAASQLYGGVSAGFRFPVSTHFDAEAGLGLYQTANLIMRGEVYQYGSTAFQNLNYAYNLQNQRVMLEGKILTSWANRYHPYLSAGIGAGNNRSYDYQETPTQSTAVADPPFSNDNQANLVYAAGLGVDVDIAPHWRVGAGYEYSYFGKAQLGPSPAQQTTTHLKSGRLHANQLMLQMSYAG